VLAGQAQRLLIVPWYRFNQAESFLEHRAFRDAITASISADADVAPCVGPWPFAGRLAKVAAAILEAAADTPESS
jgi:hypothetical protein